MVRSEVNGPKGGNLKTYDSSDMSSIVTHSNSYLKTVYFPQFERSIQLSRRCEAGKVNGP